MRPSYEQDSFSVGEFFFHFAFDEIDYLYVSSWVCLMSATLLEIQYLVGINIFL